MTMKEYSIHPKAPRLKPHHQIQHRVISYPSANEQSAYSTASPPHPRHGGEEREVMVLPIVVSWKRWSQSEEELKTSKPQRC